MKARPYQAEAERSIFDGFPTHPSQLLVMATGLGKTVVMAHVAQRWVYGGHQGRVLMIAHREELIRQSVDRLEHAVGRAVGIEMGQERSGQHTGPVAVATVQTLQNRLGKFPPESVGLLLIDEAHHAVAGGYRKVINHFRVGNPACRVLGVTATPKRADELAMGNVFDHCCFDYGIAPAVQDGWLVPVVQRAVKCKSLDFSKVRQTAGDLNEGDLDQIVRQEKVLHEVCAPVIEESDDMPALVFGVTVAHAHDLAAVLNRYKPHSAVALDGKTNRDHRRDQVEKFKQGRFQYLVNCGLFLEGFDAPNTACVVMARPTKSLSLYTQVLGRGTRPLPGTVDGDGLEEAKARRDAIARSAKPRMLVLDFVGNSGRHKIVTAMDVLGGKYGQAVRDYAEKLSASEGPNWQKTVDEALEQAACEVAFIQEVREMQRRRAVKARAEYDARAVSPFQGGGPAGKLERPAPPPAEAATDKQVSYLVYRAGWKRADTGKLTRKQASAIIGRHKQAEEAVRGKGGAA